MRLPMLRGRGLAPEDCRSAGMLGSGGRAPRSGIRIGRTPDLSGRWAVGRPQDARPEGVSRGRCRVGPSARRHSPAGRGARPARPGHPPGLQQQRGLGPLGSQVGGHRLGCSRRAGAEQGEPQRDGAQEQPQPQPLRGSGPRHGTPRRGKRETPSHATPRSAPPGAPPPTSGGGSCRPLLRRSGRGRAHACPVAGPPRGCSEGPPPGLGEPGLPYQAIASWSCPSPAGQGPWMRASSLVRVTWGEQERE